MPNQPTSSYSDVAPIMKAASEQEAGLLYRLPTYNQAVNFRQRCYRWRKNMLKLAAQQMGEVPGLEPSTAYDSLQLTIVNGAGETIRSRPDNPQDPHAVKFIHAEPTGELLDLDGNPLTLTSPTPGLGLESD